MRPNSNNLYTMKKIIASLIVCGFAVAMVACGGKKVDEAQRVADSIATADSIAAAAAAAAPVVVDTVAAVVDSAAVVK